ncbi:MAG: caspase family protein [Gemmataceae bacterium]
MKASCWWLVLLTLVVGSPPGFSQERRNRVTPGLVLDTGARHASCDVLFFSPSGLELFAGGDDKVVRVWKVGQQSILPTGGRTLRWPTYREQRGCIFAAALSPNDAGKRMAVAGFGVKTGLITVLNRHTGDILHTLEKPLSTQVTTALTWSPDGKYVVFGSADGELFRWEPATGSTSPERFAGPAPEPNRVRLVAFVDAHHFLAVMTDGKIWRRDVREPRSASATPLASFQRRHLITAALSPNHRWLIALVQNVTGEKGPASLHGELMDLRNPGRIQQVHLPSTPGFDLVPTAVAFDPTSELFAIGSLEARAVGEGSRDFANVIGGRVHVFRPQEGALRMVNATGLPIGYTVDGLAFRPARKENPESAFQLAVAGGPNHEVRLFDFRGTGKLLSTIRSPGSCLWSVAFSTQGKYLAWRDQLNTRPRHPNDRGAGPWRVFTLDLLPGQKVRSILPTPPADFRPVLPLPTVDEWRVQPTSSGFYWRILGPDGTDVTLDRRNGLYDERVNQLPRCYTFLPARGAQPPRLAVGHTWGISIYELRPNDVRLARLLVGHESEVMAVGPSPDGKLLLSAGRDQTIACWSLEDWPDNREMGALFQERGGTLRVRKVHPGSPGWETGMTDEDEILLVVSKNRTGPGGFAYLTPGQTLKQHGLVLANPTLVKASEAARLLNAAEPGREYIFVWKHGGKQNIQLTTVRQRPLWRFFPTRAEEGSQWVIWRWRDFYYDTTGPNADRLLGWQVHSENLNVRPAFHPLKNINARRDGSTFRNPDKIWRYVRLPFQDAQKVLFADIEPPEVQLTVVTTPVTDPKNPKNNRDLELKVVVRPRNNLADRKLSRVVLWLDDSHFEKPPAIDPATGAVETTLVIPRSRLRQGRNEITLAGFNVEGGRAEQTAVVVYDDPTRPRPSLHGLAIGINDYRLVKNYPRISNLNYSRPDAEAVAAILAQHENSRLFRQAHVETLLDKQTTRQEILTRLRAIATRAKPDDFMVLFLSGHGLSDEHDRFIYLSAGSDGDNAASSLNGEDLLRELSSIPCRKLILLDTCHSGSLVSNPLRDLLRDNDRLRIFTACAIDQQAREPNPSGFKLKPELARYRHGFFTEGILEALGRPELFDKKLGRQTVISSRDLADSIETTVGNLLVKFEQSRLNQTPVFVPHPRETRREEILCKP